MKHKINIDKRLFCVIYKSMKFRYLAHLSVSFILGVTSIIAAQTTQENNSKKPANTGKTQLRPLKYITDTVYVTPETKITKCAAGRFVPATNTIIIYYFIPKTPNEQLEKTCNLNNTSKRYVLRHEYEHARKAALTKHTEHLSPMTRARVAALNEVMAPAGEIVEAIEAQHYETQTEKPGRKFIKNALTEINDQCKPNNISPYFYTQQVADIIMKHATQHYVNQTADGTYIHGLRKAYFNNKKSAYKPNLECAKINKAMFIPQVNMWAPLWDFETKYGTINLWELATKKQKQEMMQKIDSIIYKTTGQNSILLKRHKTR